MRRSAWPLFWAVLLAQVRAAATDDDAACVWPQCAPMCEPCDLEPLLLAEEHAICKMGICICKPLFCARGTECHQQACSLGASPPPYEPTFWVHFFNRLGPGVEPPSEATPAWWVDFAKGAVYQKPSGMLLVGLVIAVLTSICLCTGLEQEYGWLPKSPHLLLCWALMLTLLISVGLMLCHMSMMRTYDIGLQQLAGVHGQLEEALETGLQLNASCASIQEAVHAVPGSCSNSITRKMMEELVELADKATASKFNDVYKLIATLSMTTHMTGEVRRLAAAVGPHLRWLPILPMILMLAAVLFVIAATLVWWVCGVQNRITELADLCMIRLGDCLIPLLVVAAAGLAAMYLEAGIVTATFCTRVDDNVMTMVRNHDWNRTVHMKSMDPNELMMQAAYYYLFGNFSNPMLAALDEAKQALLLMARTLDKGEKISNMAEIFCPALGEIESDVWVTQLDKWVSHMNMTLSAAAVWPHYAGVTRTSLCGNLVGSLGMLLLVSSLIGLVCFPTFALLAEYDLEEWVEEKEQADEEGAEQEEPGHAPQKYELLGPGSSPAGAWHVGLGGGIAPHDPELLGGMGYADDAWRGGGVGMPYTQHPGSNGFASGGWHGRGLS